MIELSGDRIGPAEVRAVAEGEPVRLSEKAWESIMRSHRAAQDTLGGGPVYGRTTGVGANKGVAVAGDEELRGMRLLRSHAVSSGPPLGSAPVRAMIAVRLNQMACGGSGVDPEVPAAMVRMLQEDALPRVRTLGGVGTADLPALASLGLTLAGEREATRPFVPVGAISSASALPLISSSALTIGTTLLTVGRLEVLLDAVEAVYVLSLTGLEGNLAPMEADAAAAVGTPAARDLGMRLRTATRGAAWRARAVQDTYGLRAFIPSHSVVLTAVARLDDLAKSLTASAQENPLFLPGGPYHHGAFLQAPLAHELSSTTRALAQATALSMSRIRLLNDPAQSGLPAFLSPRGQGRSGTMVVEYVAGAATGQILGAVNALEASSLVLSRGMEEDASFAEEMVRGLERATDAARVLVACEALEATRALHIRRPARLPPQIGRLLEVMGPLDEDGEDRDLEADLDRAEALVDELAAVYRDVVG